MMFERGMLVFCLLLSLATSFSIVQSLMPQEQQHYYPDLKQFRDDKSNITDDQLSKIKQLIQTAEGTYLSTDLSKIAQVIYDGLYYFPASYKLWHVFVYANGVKQIGIGGAFYKNKWIWFTNYGKFNLTYALICDWAGSAIRTFGGSGTAQFGENVNSTYQDQILTATNNSIIYKGNDISAAASYINQKMATDWFVVIASPNTSYGYCRGSYFKQVWASLRAYGDFKWNYYLFR